MVMRLLVTDGCGIFGRKIKGFVREHDRRDFTPNVAAANGSGNLENLARRAAAFEDGIQR